MKYLNKSDVNLSWTSFEGREGVAWKFIGWASFFTATAVWKKEKTIFRHICGFISASINTSSKNRPLFCVSWCFMVVGGDGDKRVEKLWTILGLKRQRQAAGRADDRFNMWRLRNGKNKLTDEIEGCKVQFVEWKMDGGCVWTFEGSGRSVLVNGQRICFSTL